MTIVSIVRAEDVVEGVKKAIELCGGLNIRDGDGLVIKPNVKNQAPPGYGIITDPKVVEPLVDICRRSGVKGVTISEGSAYPSGSYHTISAFEAAGYAELAKKWGLDLADLNSYDSVDLVLEDGLVLDWVKVGRSVVEADYLINVPVLKTHKQTLLSNCLKNIGVGVACREEKKRLHRLGIDEALVDVYSAVKPHFNIVDATVAMEGDGPNLPPAKAKPLGLIMAGEDGLAVDTVCAKLMGFEPSEIKHIQLAYKKGLGTMDMEEIEVKGLSIEEVATHFERPSTFK
jgi:uncharacterized protein (DUF362 family)